MKGILAKTIYTDADDGLQDVITESYLLERIDSPVFSMLFAPVVGMPAHVTKKLGGVRVGIAIEER